MPYFAYFSLFGVWFVSGWYLVWKLFLSRFRLVRELLGQMNDSSSPLHANYDQDNKKTNKNKKIRRDN